MLRVLQSQIDSYRAEIEKLFAQHPDHDLFGSLPDAGPKIAPIPKMTPKKLGMIWCGPWRPVLSLRRNTI
jgi:hypothetical protein